MTIYMILEKIYKFNNINVVIYRVEEGLKKKYFAGLFNNLNFAIWGEGQTGYEALIDAMERWSNSFGGFNPFAHALQQFP